MKKLPNIAQLFRTLSKNSGIPVPLICLIALSIPTFSIWYAGTITNPSNQADATLQTIAPSPATPQPSISQTPAPDLPSTTRATPGPSNAWATAKNTPAPTSLPNCRAQSIPYKTTIQDASWLDIGQTSETIGLDGSEYVCDDGTTTVFFQPTNKIVYQGTHQPVVSTQVPPSPTPNALAKEACDNNRISALGQLSAAGAASGSAYDELQLRYTQCLHNAGY